MNNSQIAQKEILLFSKFHLLSCLYPLFLSRLKLDLDDPVIETVETIKMGLLVLGSFNLYFKSLGLDITSVLLNTFKMAATYPFIWIGNIWNLIYFYQRIRWTVDSRVIHFESKKFDQSQQVSNLKTKLVEIGLDPFYFYIIILYRRYVYEVVPIDWLALTLDPCPPKMN